MDFPIRPHQGTVKLDKKKIRMATPGMAHEKHLLGVQRGSRVPFVHAGIVAGFAIMDRGYRFGCH